MLLVLDGGAASCNSLFAGRVPSCHSASHGQGAPVSPCVTEPPEFSDRDCVLWLQLSRIITPKTLNTTLGASFHPLSTSQWRLDFNMNFAGHKTGSSRR